MTGPCNEPQRRLGSAVASSHFNWGVFVDKGTVAFIELIYGLALKKFMCNADQHINTDDDMKDPKLMPLNTYKLRDVFGNITGCDAYGSETSKGIAPSVRLGMCTINN